MGDIKCDLDPDCRHLMKGHDGFTSPKSPDNIVPQIGGVQVFKQPIFAVQYRAKL